MPTQRLLLALPVLVVFILIDCARAGDTHKASTRLHLHDPAEHQIVVSDLKMDDLGSIDTLASLHGSHVHIVGSNLADHGRAKATLDDFMSKQGHGKQKYTYYGGEMSVMHQNVKDTHEQHFLQTPTSPDKKVNQIFDRIPKGATTDIWHIAPAHPGTIDRLATDKHITLRNYHHVQGYNTTPKKLTGDAKADGEAMHDFLSTIGEKIKQVHPKADVTFSSNRASFSDIVGGSTQPLPELRKVFPKKHLKAATKDPFYIRTLKKVESTVAAPARTKNPALPHLHPSGDHSRLTPESVRSAVYGEDSHKLRRHLTDYMEKAMPHIQATGDTKLLYRAEHGVLAGLRATTPTVEMCDDVHVDACISARKAKENPAYEPVRFHHAIDPQTGASNLDVKEADAIDAHGYLLVNRKGADYTKRLQDRRRTSVHHQR